jgi:hypothetical protein
MQTGVGSGDQALPVLTHQLIATTPGFAHMHTKVASGLPDVISQGSAHSINYF